MNIDSNYKGCFSTQMKKIKNSDKLSVIYVDPNDSKKCNHDHSQDDNQ